MLLADESREGIKKKADTESEAIYLHQISVWASATPSFLFNNIKLTCSCVVLVFSPS